MANYDSDSSDGETGYTTTNVILGYASQESSGDEISHIGGHPVWLDGNITPPLSFSKCKNCSGYLSLLLQLNADLQQHFPHDTRRIFVLSCKNRTCSRKPGSIRAFREVRKPHVKKSTASSPKYSTASPPGTTQSEGLGNLLFGGSGPTLGNNSNPFASPSSNLTTTNANAFARPPSSPTHSTTGEPVMDIQPPTETFAEKLKLDGSDPVSTKSDTSLVEKWPAISTFPQSYPQFYLDAYPEELDPTPASAEVSSSQAQYDVEDTSATGKERDTFESSLDKTFQKFSDLVAQNPEQVLRYEFNGQPLLYSGADAVSSRFVLPHNKAGAVKGMPRCESCGAQRVFELQLMPYLIHEMERSESPDINDGMEWGTVIVGTCVNNCGEHGAVDFREEWVGTQWEERIPKK